jgi:hypothetical protein
MAQITDEQLTAARGLAQQLVAILFTPQAGVDPTTLKLQALVLVAKRQSGATDVFAVPGVVNAWRAVKRDDNIDVSNDGNVLGVIRFDGPGADPGFYTRAGVNTLQDFTRWLVKQPGGVAEVEVLNDKGWVNVATGDVNTELALEDGSAGKVSAA